MANDWVLGRWAERQGPGGLPLGSLMHGVATDEAEKPREIQGLTGGPLPQAVGAELGVSAARCAWGWPPGRLQHVDDVEALGLSHREAPGASFLRTESV